MLADLVLARTKHCRVSPKKKKTVCFHFLWVGRNSRYQNVWGLGWYWSIKQLLAFPCSKLLLLYQLLKVHLSPLTHGANFGLSNSIWKTLPHTFPMSEIFILHTTTLVSFHINNRVQPWIPSRSDCKWKPLSTSAQCQNSKGTKDIFQEREEAGRVMQPLCLAGSPLSVAI